MPFYPYPGVCVGVAPPLVYARSIFLTPGGFIASAGEPSGLGDLAGRRAYTTATAMPPRANRRPNPEAADGAPIGFFGAPGFGGEGPADILVVTEGL